MSKPRAFLDESLTEAELNPELTRIEQLGCFPYSEHARKNPGRCYFALDARDGKREPECCFPSASNWGVPGCPTITHRGQSLAVRHLRLCPLTVLGAMHLGKVLSPHGYVQRGQYRVPYYNNRLRWEYAVDSEEAGEKVNHCFRACPAKLPKDRGGKSDGTDRISCPPVITIPH